MKLQDFDTLAEAKAYQVTQGRMVSRHIIIATLVQAGILVALQRMRDDDANPFQDAMTGFFDPGISDYNFQTNHPIGQANLGLLDAMISADIGGLGAALTAVRSEFVALANVLVNPYSGATEHEWALAKGGMVRVEKTPANGFLQVATTADCERHNPQISVKVGEEFVRVASFTNVEKAGTYTAVVPRNHSSLWVDDAYGVM